jgi:hypothetical protein
MTPEEFLTGVEQRLAATDGVRGQLGLQDAPSDLAKLTAAVRAILTLVDNSANFHPVGMVSTVHVRDAITDALKDTP